MPRKAKASHQIPNAGTNSTSKSASALPDIRRAYARRIARPVWAGADAWRKWDFRPGALRVLSPLRLGLPRPILEIVVFRVLKRKRGCLAEPGGALRRGLERLRRSLPLPGDRWSLADPTRYCSGRRGPWPDVPCAPPFRARSLRRIHSRQAVSFMSASLPLLSLDRPRQGEKGWPPTTREDLLSPLLGLSDP